MRLHFGDRTLLVMAAKRCNDLPEDLRSSTDTTGGDRIQETTIERHIFSLQHFHL